MPSNGHYRNPALGNLGLDGGLSILLSAVYARPSCAVPKFMLCGWWKAGLAIGLA